jgi:hypothetical protein
VILTIVDHKKLVQERIEIIYTLNCKILGKKKQFAVIGDLKYEDLKSFWS